MNFAYEVMQKCIQLQQTELLIAVCASAYVCNTFQVSDTVRRLLNKLPDQFSAGSEIFIRLEIPGQTAVAQASTSE